VIRIILEIEAAVDARGLVVVAAGTFAVITSLIGGAGMTTLAAIGLVGLQVDASLAAGIGRANTLAGLADLV
jgi:hypothetical protein